MSYQSTKYINEPINLVRLEGKVDGIDKVLYVFFDLHIFNTKCNEKYFLDITQYLIRETKNKNIVYDLFIEFRTYDVIASKVNYKPITSYFNNVINIIKKLNFDESNKIQNYNDNLRIQYVDLRPLNYSEDLKNTLDIIEKSKNYVKDDNTFNDYLNKIYEDYKIKKRFLGNKR